MDITNRRESRRIIKLSQIRHPLPSQAISAAAAASPTSSNSHGYPRTSRAHWSDASTQGELEGIHVESAARMSDQPWHVVYFGDMCDL